jgi:hydrogenase-4 component B
VHTREGANLGRSPRGSPASAAARKFASVELLIVALVTLAAGGIGAATARGDRWAGRSAWMSCVAASVAGLVAAFEAFFTRSQPGVRPPGVAADVLGVAFLVVTFVVTPIVAIFANSDARSRAADSPPVPWLAFHFAVVGAVIVFSASRTIGFLGGWELALLASVVLTRARKPDRGLPERTRILVLHASLLPIIGLFALHLRATGTLLWTAAAPTAPRAAMLILLASAFLVHVSAAARVCARARTPCAALAATLALLFSAFLLFRFLPLLGAPRMWWGIAFVATGLAVGVDAAREVRRSGSLFSTACFVGLAHAGVIAIGIGASLLGIAASHPVLAVLGSAGALMHTLNTALFTTLLLLCACAIQQAVGTDEVPQLGGLLRRMPDTAATLLIAGAAAAGAPGTNGFASQMLLIVAGAYAAVRLPQGTAWAIWLAVLAQTALAFIASRTVRRAVNATLLGAPRGDETTSARDVRSSMRIPMHALSVFCGVLGVFPVLAFLLVAPGAIQVSATMLAPRTDAVHTALEVLKGLMWVALASWTLLGIMLLTRMRSAMRRRARAAPTPQ